jgi:ATP-dependent Clp protease adaptor protein ClpS
MSGTKWLEDEDVAVDVLDDIGTLSSLIVHNDDINTFDWVIKSLMEICKHSSEQAEQLSLIIHFKGKATVKTGEINILRPMKEGLTDRGISATIEKI